MLNLNVSVLCVVDCMCDNVNTHKMFLRLFLCPLCPQAQVCFISFVHSENNPKTSLLKEME